MLYVKIENGKIVEGPKNISSSESDSPNIHWGYNQLKANGYFIVDLAHDPMTEKIDYANPVITEDAVIYPILHLNASEGNAEWNKRAIFMRSLEYPPINEIIVALWEKVIEGRPESADLLQEKRLAIKSKWLKK